MHPAVSVVVPNYRHAGYLNRRLDSILAQTFQDFELIILDDASQDGSQAIIKSYLRDPRVSFHLNERNSGNAFSQWAKGLDFARGEYVWVAESDDYAEPAFLETLLAIAKRHPTAGIVYCQSDLVDEHSEFIRPMLDHYAVFGDPGRWRTDHFNSGRNEVSSYLMLRNIMPNASACLFRRDAFASIGGPVLGYRLCGDWLTYARLLTVSDVAFCASTLNHYRLHPHTARRETERALLEPLETYQALSSMAELVPVTPAVRSFAAALTFQRMRHLMIERRLCDIPIWGQIVEAAAAFDPDFSRRVSDPAWGEPQTAAFYFADDGIAFSEASAQRRLLPSGQPWIVRAGPCKGVPRLDPSSREGYGVLLSATFRDVEGTEIWRADSSSGFAGASLTGTAARVADPRGLGFYAWGPDPIVLFPGFTPPASAYFVECEIAAGAAG